LREIIFKQFVATSLSDKIRSLMCKIFVHTWKMICDIKIARKEGYAYYLMISKCIYCNCYDFWILREKLKNEKKRHIN